MAIDEVCVDEYLVIDGCTDPTALNYDANANNDDGSCNYCVDNQVGVTFFDSYGDGWNGAWMYVYDSFGDGWNGGILTVNGVDYTGAGSLSSFDLCIDLSICTDIIYTAGSWSAENSWDVVDASGAVIASGPNASGTVGAGCPVLGCTDSTAVNYDPTANTDDGSCDYLGCTNPTAVNYDANATIDDGSCTFACSLDEVTVNLYDSFGDGWNGNSLTVGGVDYTITTGTNASFANICIDLSVCNTATYNATGSWQSENSWDIVDASGAVIASGGANSGDFGNCFVQVDGCTDPAYLEYDAAANTDDGSCLTLIVNGCTDPMYVEYDATANVDDGSCLTLVVTGCTDTTACNYDAAANTDDGSCLTDYGCTDPTQFNYDASATCDDGSCIPVQLGCTDPSASNYNSAANTDDGSCVVTGCTDPTATNYDATATVDDGTCTYDISGCTDPAATNYDATATVDDGSCIYPTGCSESAITGLFIDGIIDDRVNANFDNMNTYDATGAQVCRVDQIRIQYRPVGTSAWSQKNIASPTGYDAVTGNCNSTQATMKPVRNLTLATTYEWRVKVWYCSGGNGGWTDGANFTTAGECPNVGNLTVTVNNPTKATFDWDNSNGSYEFARIKVRVDSLTNVQASDWFLVGGFGVMYGTYTKQKNGLTPGETYRGQARTWCDPNGGAYNALAWSPLVTWTQPTSRIEGGEAIANLDVYPNPSRDIFNVAFTSDDVQDLEVRVINVVGEAVYTENLEQFVGEYTKMIDLGTYTKGVYFLEITTNNGVVNKKLILQ
jgi:hypothetical protein